MSKPVKNLMIRDYTDRLKGEENAVVVSIRGIPGKDNNKMRLDLAKKRIKITVVRNNLARVAFKNTPLAVLEDFLEGPSALVAGGDSVVDVARELIKWAKQIANLELKGAVLDGTLFKGKAGIEALSKYPTRDEALAQAVTLILSPARNLVGQIQGPGCKIASLVKAIETKLEKGETIAKIA